MEHRDLAGTLRRLIAEPKTIGGGHQSRKVHSAANVVLSPLQASLLRYAAHKGEVVLTLKGHYLTMTLLRAMHVGSN